MMTTTGSPKDKLSSLQALRALAAISVIVDHSILELGRDDGQPAGTAIAYALGTFGVDLFFVISGFIMVYIAWNEIGSAGAAPRFLVRRILRIAPLYWIATVAALAYHRVSNTHGANADLWDLTRSVLFIPYQSQANDWVPVLPQGWTLNYEMMFYIIFAVALSLHRKVALPFVVACLVALPLIGPFLPPGPLAYLASPIVMWFAVGIILGWAWRTWRLSEPSWVSTKLRLVVPIGDASYSTYLVHGLVITLVIRAWKATAGQVPFMLVPVSLALALLAGHVVHRVLEKPVWRVVARSQALIKASLGSTARVRIQ